MTTMDVLTFFVAVFGGLTFLVYRNIRDHTMEVERAYIGFGTWLNIGIKVDGKQELLMTVQFYNFGETPGEIDTVVLAYDIGDSTPRQPPNYVGC